MEAERLGLDVQVEIVAKALPGFGRQVAAVGLRRAEETELHALWLIPFRLCRQCHAARTATCRCGAE